MRWRDQTAVCLATGFFIGRAPFAPGTFGSLLGLPLCAVLLISRAFRKKFAADVKH